MKVPILILAAFAAVATPDFNRAVLVLTGAGCVEDLDETTMERFRSLSAHPIDLNHAGRSRLMSSGLLSQYQVASLLEYRQATGDILSYEELALVDGFPPQVAEALRLFTRLEALGPPGKRRRSGMHHDVMIRGAARTGASAWGVKYKGTIGESFEFNWGTTYSDGVLRPGTFSAAVYGTKHLGKLVLGHFNARFGQGLTQWSGFSMPGYSSVDCMKRSGTGFSLTSSFSPELMGIAADFEFGRWNAALGYSWEGKLPIAAVTYVSKTFTAGITATSHSAGADWRIGIPNASIFGELAWNKGPQAVCGVMWIPEYGRKLAAVARYTDGNPELMAGLKTPAWDAVGLVSSKQVRLMARWAPTLQVGKAEFVPSLRLSARKTDSWRLEGRGEMQLEGGGWMLRSRLDLVKCTGFSFLVNAEAGRSEGALRAWVRWSLFRVDNWADRIWVYERDAPGNFNVPAYYGKGWSASLYTAWKPSRRHAIYLRVSYISYPWMSEQKPSRTEVKLQYQLSL